MEVFITNEIFKVKELNITEKVVLAIYKYYTEKGKYKCCSMTNLQIADELGITIWYMNKIKRHLKELGYIKTVGIKVIYLGIQDCTIVQSKTVPEYTEDCTIVQSKTVPEYTEDCTIVQGTVPEYTEYCTIVQSKTVPEYTHKEEKKEKEEEKKKKEEKWVTNIKLLFANLPKDYQTKERVSYIKDNYMDKLNEVDLNEGGILDTWVVNIKNVLNKVYPQDFIIEKEEPRNNTVDVL